MQDGFDSAAVVRAMDRARERVAAVRAVWSSAVAGGRAPYGAARTAFPDHSARVYMVRTIRAAAARGGPLPAMSPASARCTLGALQTRREALTVDDLYALCDLLRLAADLSDDRAERTGCHAYRGVAHAELIRRVTKSACRR